MLIRSIEVEVHFTCSLYVLDRPGREILLWLWSNFGLVYFTFFSKKRKIEETDWKTCPLLLDLLRSILEGKDTGTEDAAFFSANPSPQQKSSTPLQPSGLPAEMCEGPAPRVVSEDELSLVRTCLQRWRNEIEQDVQGWP